MDSYFNDIEYQINKQISLATNRILIAVAWFTNSNIGNELLRNNNVDIEIIVDDNLVNRNSNILAKLIERNIEISFIKDLHKDYYLMHNKFCIIDSKTVMTGSYNWTNNANSNDENITVFKNVIAANLYTQEFRRIKDLDNNNDKLFLTSEETNDVVEKIYASFKHLLKSNLLSLETGLLANWSNKNVKNQIRKLNETIRNNSKKRIEKFQLSIELYSKYGLGYSFKAKDEDKIEIKDRLKKEGLSEIDYRVEFDLNLYKLKAIKKIRDNYIILLEKNINDEETSKRIFKIIDFVNKEQFMLISKLDTKHYRIPL